jgi:hypothetical protein
MHEYKAGGVDVTMPVSPASAAVHVGSPDTDPLSIWTVYTPLTGSGGVGFPPWLPHPPINPNTPLSAATDTTSCVLITGTLFEQMVASSSKQGVALRFREDGDGHLRRCARPVLLPQSIDFEQRASMCV